MIGGLRSIAARGLADLKHYPRKSDWALSLYQQILFRGRRWPGRDATVAIRVSGDPEPLYLRLGSSDWLVLEQVFHRGEYTPVIAAVPGADTIIDLGANIGCTVRLWRRHYPSARIVAVEPDATNVELLRRNTAADRLTEIIAAAVVGIARPISLRREGGPWNYRVAPQFSQENAVAAITMDELFAKLGVSRVDLLKCDIEGTEREVFECCASWIRLVREIAIEVHAPLSVSHLMSLIAAARGDFELLASMESGGHPLCILRNRAVGD
jgi:FkbM family methyltransferase